MIDLDATDRAILDVLQDDGRISNAALAERVNLSPSPCLRRTRALESSGLIAGYRAELDRAKLGLGLTVFVEMKISDHSSQSGEAIAAAFAAAPEIVAAHIVSGSADILLEVVVADLPAYERLLFDTLLALPSVIDVRSNFALRAVKPRSSLSLTRR